MYLMTVYGNGPMLEWFTAAYKATGKKLDMGKACIRFRTLDDIPLDVIAAAVARVPVATYIESVESALRAAKERRSGKPATKG
jgi:hypothetical protein